MNVRALPTWRNPVGEGAKRTRGLACEDEFMDSNVGSGTSAGQAFAGLAFPDLTFDGTGSQKDRQAGAPNRFAMQPFDSKRLSKADSVLKSYCVLQARCENIGALFPPETEPARLARGVFTDPMNSIVITTVLIPGFVSALLFGVFSYLYAQSRQPYFLAWKWAWALYSLHYVLDAFPASPIAFFVSELFLVAMALCIFVSTRLMRSSYRFRWYDVAVGTAGVALALITLWGHIVNGVFRPDVQPMIRLGLGLAVILLYCSWVYFWDGHKRGSLAFQVLAIALAIWAALMAVGQLQSPLGEMFGNASRLFGPGPQLLLGIAMVMVLF